MSTNISIHNIETVVELVPTRKQGISEKSYVRVIEFRDKNDKLIGDLALFADNPQKLVIQGRMTK